ncbi:glycoside hydrolase family 73 protein [Leuconostocaceae bacterium ESL0958]|nr:glycoside hydrolase family 73 protein [Leuconostocaceae bacterium ESL0958]
MAQRKKFFVLPKNKKTRRTYFFLAFLFVALLVSAIYWRSTWSHSQQSTNLPKSAEEKLLNEWAPYAQKLQKDYQVLASVSLAQAILESNWGQSELAQQAHNLYGIKASDQEPGTVIATKEYEDGQWVTIDDRFRTYQNWQASMKDHALLLSKGTNWNPKQYAHVLAAKDYKAAAKALVQDGYATDPDYAAKIMTVIERWHLQRFDRVSQ